MQESVRGGHDSDWAGPLPGRRKCADHVVTAEERGPIGQLCVLMPESFTAFARKPQQDDWVAAFGLVADAGAASCAHVACWPMGIRPLRS